MALTNEQYRAGALAFVNRKTGCEFVEGEIPADVEIAMEMLVMGMKQNPGIASQSLGDMSKSFFDSNSYEKAAMRYLKPYMKLKIF